MRLYTYRQTFSRIQPLRVYTEGRILFSFSNMRDDELKELLWRDVDLTDLTNILHPMKERGYIQHYNLYVEGDMRLIDWTRVTPEYRTVLLVERKLEEVSITSMDGPPGPAYAGRESDEEHAAVLAEIARAKK